ncbi:MAG: tetratricopeptide repeat protein [Crocinitomicaceae bacterium]
MSEDLHVKNDWFSKLKSNKGLFIGSVIIGIGLLTAVGYFAYIKFFWEPTNEESKTIAWKAEKYLEIDSLDLALNGKPGDFEGLLSIASEYDGYIGGDRAKFEIGLALRDQGKYQEALDYFSQVQFEDVMIGTFAIGAQGDCYSEMNQLGEALTKYEEAYKRKPNPFSTPYFMMKAAAIHETNGDFSKALELYKTIKEEYEKSDFATNIDKYIARAENS